MAGNDESNGTACGGRLRRSDHITIDGTTIWSVIGAILITLVVVLFLIGPFD
jgi:hypothetical protein